MQPFKLPAYAALVLALSAGTAMADPATGYYLSGAGGVTITSDSDIEGTGIDTEAELDPGAAGVIAFGYRYDSNYRGEIEFGLRTNDVDDLSGATSSVDGDVDAFTVMANVVYDYSYAENFRPYFGIGVGLARLDIDGATPVGSTTVDDDDTVFAIQGIAGIAYDVAQNLELFGDYRYLHGFDPEFTAANNTDVEADYNNHTVLIGLRYTFGSAPQAAEPAPKMMAKEEPAPAAPRSFIIFFDWDSAAITPQAQTILQEAAAYAKSGAPVSIALTGHADRSGTTAYNNALSKRRAEAAQTALMALGIMGKDLSTAWKGEAEPLVATADGVREPQNRRVQLVIE